MKTIEIKCSGADTLPIDKIVEFQGNLKKLSKKNLDKLKTNILKNGFVAPIFVWFDAGDNKILDGHQRLSALISLRQEGYDIPLLPVDYIHAENEEEARKMLLSITSQYGQFNKDELNNWLDQLDEEEQDFLRFVDSELKFSEDKLYTNKIETPKYEPKNKKPDIDDLYNDKKYKSLISEIEESSIPEQEKEFLKIAAMRHIVFNYKKIADYYSNSEKPTQELMENSALVIIDFNKAIEQGYIKLSKKIGEQYEKDK